MLQVVWLFDRLSSYELTFKKKHLVLIRRLIFFFLFFSLWKTVTVHSLARVTTPRTTKPLTPQCSRCQILSVFSWKLDDPRCCEVGLQTDRHTTAAAETHLSESRLMPNLRMSLVCPYSLKQNLAEESEAFIHRLWHFTTFKTKSKHKLVSGLTEYVAQFSRILIYTNNPQWWSFPGGRNNQFSLDWQRQSELTGKLKWQRNDPKYNINANVFAFIHSLTGLTISWYCIIK